MTMGGLYVFGAGMAFLAILVTGRRLSRLAPTGKTFLLMAHKLLSLAAATLLASIAYHVGRVARLAPSDWVSAVGAGVLLVASMVTGGMASRHSRASRGVRIAHRVTSLLTLLASAVAIYFLLVRI